MSIENVNRSCFRLGYKNCQGVYIPSNSWTSAINRFYQNRSPAAKGIKHYSVRGRIVLNQPPG